MARSRNDKKLYWFAPEMRGILPLEDFHVPRKLQRIVKQQPFALRCNAAFPQVIRACADSREDTWINDAIIRSYTELWETGFAHSVECWEGNTLAGGLYGIALGGAFFGESMFSHVPNASKIALVELVKRLRTAGYRLLDTQYTNPHLVQFGVKEIPKQQYLMLLQQALAREPANAFADIQACHDGSICT